MAEKAPVRGFRDLIHPESSRTAALEALARETLARYGFSEVRLPTLESRELFVKSTGETSDIVEKEMFQLEDQGGRRLALRPEGTPGAVRAYLDKSLRQQGGPVKLFYVGSMFRAERPQKGRFREFEQIGVELFGNAHPSADVEAILALQELFRRLRLDDQVTLKLNNLGCNEKADCRPRYRGILVGFLSARRDGLCDDCKQRLDRNPLRVLDCKKDGPALRQELPAFQPCADCHAHVEQVATLLAVNGIGHLVRDPNLVRGLDYYTRTVFEFSAKGLGSQDAVAGGGRYDSLIGQMGGPSTPAVGWALGVERLLLAVEAAHPDFSPLPLPAHKAEVTVIVQNSELALVTEGTRILNALRRFGIAAGGLFGSSMKAQFREADRHQSRLCVILGESELAAQPRICQLKDMQTGTQQPITLDDIVEAVSSRLNQHRETARA